MDSIKLKEYSQSPSVQLNLDHLNLLLTRYKKQLGVRSSIDGSGYMLTSNSYVGVYDLVDFKVIVEPKIDKLNIFKMLTFAYDLVFWYEEKSELNSIEELFEYLVLVFQRQVDRLIKKGLLADYVLVKERLNYAKGKIGVNSLVEKPWEKHLIDCNYDSYKVDILENQIIKYTIYFLKKYVKNAKVRRALVNTNRYLEEVSLKYISVRDIDRVQYTTLNKHYKSIHNFCRLFLELFGVNEKQGEMYFNQFCVDMNQLYEKYIGKLLKNELRKDSVKLQMNSYLDEYDQINIKPDIVVSDNQNHALIIDTKYKASKQIEQNDIYQMAVYMSSFNADGVLLYPSFEIEETEYFIDGRTLYIKTIDLNKLDKNSKELVDWIKGVVNHTNKV
ncbi:McrC family protein [Natranaerobius trueperi]|uniref:Restriction endonuclease n=1 Tax=Natranaerobius trueperi TaxID=759412 RepID=A0A226BYV7_9FIRM|nr:hypothetical protein [Natranaerobius trueperi]OWZ84111.1 hypothetical protein CDO51_05190 [Natranaerobius trueperi]